MPAKLLAPTRGLEGDGIEVQVDVRPDCLGADPPEDVMLHELEEDLAAYGSAQHGPGRALCEKLQAGLSNARQLRAREETGRDGISVYLEISQPRGHGVPPAAWGMLPATEPVGRQR